MNRFNTFKQIINIELIIVALVSVTTFGAEPEYNLYRGQETRVGHHSLSQDGHNPGLSNLLWWDPVLLGDEKSFLSEMMPSAGVPSEGTNAWTSSLAAKQKSISYLPQANGEPAYFFAKTVSPLSDTELTKAKIGAKVSAFSWTFKSSPKFPLAPGNVFEIDVNIPNGPTDGLFPQRFFVYSITGVEGGPLIIIVDSYEASGGFASMGQLFKSTGEEIKVTLYNTLYRGGGQNPDDQAGKTLVYAGTTLLRRAKGSYIASPIVAQLKENDPGIYPWRAVGAKNEKTLINIPEPPLTEKAFELGMVTSYTYSGDRIHTSRASNEDQRQNIVWSWPVPAPDKRTDLLGFESAKENFVTEYRKLYPDAVPASLTIQSTPIQVNAKVIPLSGRSVQDLDVLVVAREDGHIFALDAKGDVATGTTTQIWEYPSQSTSVGDLWRPGPFGLSSALIHRFPASSSSETQDFYYIASENGRVYALQMTGDGKGNTDRQWTFPANRSLGRLSGSVVFVTNTKKQDLILIPSEEGALYAVDALGDPNTKTTTQQWRFPSEGQTLLAPIKMTPSVEFGSVYFGDESGKFYSVDLVTGVEKWSFQADNGFDTQSPVTIPKTGLASGMPNLVVFTDINGNVYGLDAATGKKVWVSTDLEGASPSGSLTFTNITAEDLDGNPVENIPVVFVPLADGRLVALFANQTHLDSGNGRIALEIEVDQALRATPSFTSIAVGGQVPSKDGNYCWMYAADSLGNFYAFSNENNPKSPGQQPIPPRPTPEKKKKRKINFSASFGYLSQADYEKINPTGMAHLEEEMKKMSIQTLRSMTKSVTRRVFEFGERIYGVIYDFIPSDNEALNPEDIKGLSITARQGNETIYAKEVLLAEGISVYIFEYAADCMKTANPPTPGRHFWRFNLGGSRLSRKTLNIPIGDREFYLAHPIAMSLTIPKEISVPTKISGPPSYQQIGIFTDLSGFTVIGEYMDQLLGNGMGRNFRNTDHQEYIFRQFFYENIEKLDSLNLNFYDGLPANQLDPDMEWPKVEHGNTALSRLYIWDRSLMFLMGKKLLVSFKLKDLPWVLPSDKKEENEKLNWGVVNPLDPKIYEGYEDLPSQTPNVSVDYPDLSKNVLKAFKSIRNNKFSVMVRTAALLPPNDEGGYVDYNKGYNRELVPTTFDFMLEVPLFQPPSLFGYEGRGMHITLDPRTYLNQPIRTSSFQRAYRVFALHTGIKTDVSLQAKTPKVSLGNLAAGSGIHIEDSVQPFPNDAKDFSILNTGNVNLLNVRVAKLKDRNPLFLIAPLMDTRAGLDARSHLFSNLDPTMVSDAFNHQVILQKSRVGEKLGNDLKINPMRRANLKNGILGGYPSNDVFKDIKEEDPKIGVILPLGAPAGNYKSSITVFEDDQDSGLPDYSSRSHTQFDLEFNIKENQLTNSKRYEKPYLAPMAENLQTRVPWPNVQPAVTRTQQGNLYVAWTSNRLEENKSPGWQGSTLVAGNPNDQNKWRIYFASLQGSPPKDRILPLSDLDHFQGDKEKNQWFRQVPPFEINISQLFPEKIEIVEETVRYGSPVFAEGTDGREPAENGRYFIFVADALTKTLNAKEQSFSAIGFLRLNLTDPAKVEWTQLESFSKDPLSIKSRPALVQIGNKAILFYTATTGGKGQIYWAHFNGEKWGMPNSLQVGNGFESISGPTVIFKEKIYNLVVAAKLQGRDQSELFYIQIQADENEFPKLGTQSQNLLRQDVLFQDPDKKIYYVPGVSWQILASDLEKSSSSKIDIISQLIKGQRKESILRYETKRYDPSTGSLSFECTLGGYVVLDTKKGTVQFSDALIPQNMELKLSYRPTWLRLNSGVDFKVNERYPTLSYDSINKYYFLTSVKNATGTNQVDSASSRPYLKIIQNLSQPNQMQEFAIPVLEPYNESGVSLALDPSEEEWKLSDRPRLLWLFWSSSRKGSPDIYFETLAPKL